MMLASFAVVLYNTVLFLQNLDWSLFSFVWTTTKGMFCHGIIALLQPMPRKWKKASIHAHEFSNVPNLGMYVGCHLFLVVELKVPVHNMELCYLVGFPWLQEKKHSHKIYCCTSAEIRENIAMADTEQNIDIIVCDCVGFIVWPSVVIHVLSITVLQWCSIACCVTNIIQIGVTMLKTENNLHCLTTTESDMYGRHVVINSCSNSTLEWVMSSVLWTRPSSSSSPSRSTLYSPYCLFPLLGQYW